jgi:hypothetical protein
MDHNDSSPLTPFHREDFHASGITDEVLDSVRVKSWERGWILPWSDGVDSIDYRIYDRDKRPIDPETGKPKKGQWPWGQTTPLNHLRVVEDAELDLIVEGVRQQLAALSHAPDGVSVYGLNGCWISEKIRDRLSHFAGHHLAIALDSDMWSNPDVFKAACRNSDWLLEAGAGSVRFFKYPAELVESKTDGLDDILARSPEADRAELISRLIKSARPVPNADRDLWIQNMVRAAERRPRVAVNNDAEAADWLRTELGHHELSGLFRREDVLVHTPRMGEDGYLDAADLGLKDAGPAQVRPVTTTAVKSLIESRYRVYREVDSGDGLMIPVPALFPQQSAVSACEAARIGEHAPNLRALKGVTHTPTIRPDGSILDAPGYDELTGLLYLPEPGLTVPPIPLEPTRTEVKEAVELILTPVAEFPFVTEHDRATWVGLALTPLLRPLLPGPYQLGVFTATNPGSGKTKLAKMITTLHGGVQRGELPRDADELRKSITAALMDTTAPVVTFDNLTGVVRSPVLESLLTSDTWTDRWLGQNRSVTARNDRLWLATGNNAQFGGDLARRLATVRLDPPTANHHLRTDFKIRKLDSWMVEHRGAILSAMLTVARGWVVAGKPAEDARSDDFARWVEGLRGLMDWAGFPGTFGGVAVELTMSSDDEEWHAFLVELHRAFGSDPFTVKDIVGQFRGSTADNFAGKIDPERLPGDLAHRWASVYQGKDAGFRKSLGHWLTNHIGRYAGGWSVVSAPPDTKVKVARYSIRCPK